MSEVPPPYAQYPRNTAPAYGTADQLESLHWAYRNYNWLFLANIVIAFVVGFGFGALGAAVGRGEVALFAYVILPIILGALSYPLNRRLGDGAGWSQAQVIAATVLMGLNSICCGIVGFVIIQQIAANHMKRYGLRSGFLGIKKRDVQARVAELRTGAAGTYPRP